MIGRYVKCKVQVGMLRSYFTAKKAVEWANQHKSHLLNIGYIAGTLSGCKGTCSTIPCRKFNKYFSTNRIHFNQSCHTFRLGPAPVSKSTVLSTQGCDSGTPTLTALATKDPVNLGGVLCDQALPVQPQS